MKGERKTNENNRSWIVQQELNNKLYQRKHNKHNNRDSYQLMYSMLLESTIILCIEYQLPTIRTITNITKTKDFSKYRDLEIFPRLMLESFLKSGWKKSGWGHNGKKKKGYIDMNGKPGVQGFCYQGIRGRLNNY